MPNDHGGTPRFGAPILAAAATALAIWWRRSASFVAPHLLADVLAAFFGFARQVQRQPEASASPGMGCCGRQGK